MKKMPPFGTTCFNETKIRALQRELPDPGTLSEIAERHKAIGHPRRLAILEMLGREECCVCDIAHVLEQPVSTVSQHLRILRMVGLVRSRQEGKFIFYTPTEVGERFLDGMPTPVGT